MEKGKSPIPAAIINAATKRKATDILDIILEKEPRFINSRDEEGRNVLHLAASIGYFEGVQYILEKHEFAPFERDLNGLFPIHVASIEGHVAIVQELLCLCPAPGEMLTTNYQNILHVSAKSGTYNVVSYILKDHELESLVNQQDKDGNTPLHLATMNWHPKIVHTLTRDKRVDLQLVNNEGFTALDVADHYMDRVPSYRKRITWAALRVAGTPRASFQDIYNTKKEARLVNSPSAESDLNLESTNSSNNYKDRVNTLLLVATLIATITFAAGFTAPGGYNESDPHKGMVTLLKHKEFCLFILCDMIAMYSSIIVAVTLIWAQLGDHHLVLIALRFALPLLGVALVMMSLAFTAGIYLVVKNLIWLGYVVVVTGLVFLVALSLLFFPLSISFSSNNRIVRCMFNYSFNLLLLMTGSHTNTSDSTQ